METLKWPEAPARLSAASTGGACSQCWNVYARAGPVGCIGRRDRENENWSRETERVTGEGWTGKDSGESCADACMRHRAAKVLLASDSVRRSHAVDSASTKWWQPTGIHPLHPSGEPLDPLSVSKELQLVRQHGNRHAAAEFLGPSRNKAE
jgi:hypothetical protein